MRREKKGEKSGSLGKKDDLEHCCWFTVSGTSEWQTLSNKSPVTAEAIPAAGSAGSRCQNTYCKGNNIFSIPRPRKANPAQRLPVIYAWGGFSGLSQTHGTWAGGVAFQQRGGWAGQGGCLTGQAGKSGGGEGERRQDKEMRGAEQAGDTYQGWWSPPDDEDHFLRRTLRACSEESTSFLGFVVFVSWRNEFVELLWRVFVLVFFLNEIRYLLKASGAKY